MPRKAFLVGVDIKSGKRTAAVNSSSDAASNKVEESLEELMELVRSRGYEVTGQTIQAREQPDKRYFIGSGKVSELAVLAKELGIEVFVFGDELSPIQIRNLEEALERPVLDRTAVILEIFAERAHSREGKLQVELARLRYLLPRLTGKGSELSRLGGGIGTRGPGEKELEFERRHLKNRIRDLEAKIEEIRKHRGLLRNNRMKNRIPIVALVGYTNAGKSTLLRSLTGDEQVYVDDRVFATLDPITRTSRTPRGREVVVSDTVGFIRKLPHHLVAAFRATLEEVLYADLLIHVVDASRPGVEERIDAVEEVLRAIGASEYKTLLVFNKIDLLPPGQMDRLRWEYCSPLLISARENLGIAELKEAIEKSIFEDTCRVRLFIPYEEGDIVNYLHEQALVLTKRHCENGIYLEARCDREIVNRLKEYVECEIS